MGFRTLGSKARLSCGCYLGSERLKSYSKRNFLTCTLSHVLLAVVKVPLPIACVKYKAQHVVLDGESHPFSEGKPTGPLEISDSTVEVVRSQPGVRMVAALA